MTDAPHNRDTGELLDHHETETLWIETRRTPDGRWRVQAGTDISKPPILDIHVVKDGRIGRALEQIARSVRTQGTGRRS